MAVFSDLYGINCHSCPTAYKVQRGCLSEIPAHRIPGIGLDDTMLTRCPRFYPGGAELLMLAAYREYRNGYLPNTGGWLDQPMRFIEGMEIVEAAVARVTEQRDKNGS